MTKQFLRSSKNQHYYKMEIAFFIGSGNLSVKFFVDKGFQFDGVDRKFADAVK